MKAAKVIEKKESDFQEVANKYAHNSIGIIRDELDALKHAQECDGADEKGEKCQRGQEKREYAPGKFQMCHEDPEAWHDEERAERRIQEGPLSVQVRSDWHTPGEESEPGEYLILLGTGGPASRIIGELDECKQPSTAHFQYQDWFKPWTTAQTTEEEDATLLEYAQHFYFGE